jgi:hypothetical protein
MNDGAKDAGVTPLDPGDLPFVLTQIARLAEGVKSEFDLISGRMSWLVIAESFIFSAFAAATSSYRPDHPLADVLRYLLSVLPLVGMLLVVCVYVALLAAHSVVGTLKSQRDRLIATLPARLRIDLISGHSRVQWWGNVPTHVIPPVLFVVWLGAIVLVRA